MSITDELRGYVGLGDGTVPRAIRAIADRIDAEHDMALDEQFRALTTDMEPMTDERMAEHGWVRLPVDADGEYIHIGDAMAYADNTKPMEVVALVPPAVFLTEDGPRYADMCRHYHKPTVEDVLREMHEKLDEVTALYVGEAIDSDERDRDEARIFAEYAAKLQLAGDEG